MYSKELEELIDAALADGVLTEKEKQILLKKAKAQGIDLDEFEMVLDARALKVQQSQAAHPAKEKLGNIVTCPNCGANVPGGAAVCPECGHVFSNVQIISSAKLLQKELEKVRKHYSGKKVENLTDFLINSLQLRKDADEMARIILEFPIPNTRGDLLEFLPYLKARSEMAYDGNNHSVIQACRSKYKECVMKARISFQNDPAFEPYLRKETILYKIKLLFKNWFLE
jgi:hypothetical protein